MASRGSRELQVLLEALLAGELPGSSAIASLSAMNGEECAAMQREWVSIPVSTRRQLMLQVTGLADDNVDLDFTALARMALHDEDAGVRELAVAALWESEDRHVAADLTRLLQEDPSDEVRAAAAGGLKGFVVAREFEHFDRRQGDEIVNALRSVASGEGEPAHLRATAIEALGARSLAWVRNLIEDAYYSDERELRLAALTAMGLSAGEEWSEFVIEQLGSEDPEFRFQAARACYGIATEDLVEPLSRLLDDEDPEVALAAVSGLGEIGGEAALEHLREFRRRAPGPLFEALDEAIESARSLANLIATGPGEG
ncbi:MAG: HEAT repeat domain-containing protein [Dehalococcoidia bacterium]|nr:HEAT repeat domain-containing protein [Dehalococcoidia bacterium]